MNIPQLLTLALAIAPPSFAADIKLGTVFQLGDTAATVTIFESLRYVQSEYTQRYHFDSSDNPKLPLLKQRYQLEKVVAPGRDEFDRQVHLMDWVHHRFKTMVIVKDQLCDGTQWHTRKRPENPATDLYFPIGQATVDLKPKADKLVVALKTFTPNFAHFESRQANGNWKPTSDKIEWKLNPGANQLEVRTVNAFGVTGPVSRVEVEVKGAPSAGL